MTGLGTFTTECPACGKSIEANLVLTLTKHATDDTVKIEVDGFADHQCVTDE